MSRIRIRNEAQGQPTEFYAGSLLSHGTILELDGKEIPSVRNIRLNILLNEAVQADVDLFVDEALDVEINAEVKLTIVLSPDSAAIEETPLPNGGRRIRALPRTSD